MPAASAGYSGTPLSKKLGIVAGATVCARFAPDDYQPLLAPLPTDVRFIATPGKTSDIVHLFTTERTVLTAELKTLRTAIRPDAAVWVSWPKKASKVPTDITEDTIRDVAVPMGFVDVKVCAVSEVWSGLKLVIRKELR